MKTSYFTMYFLVVLIFFPVVFIIIYGLLFFITKSQELKRCFRLLFQNIDPNLDEMNENILKLEDAITVFKSYEDIIKIQKEND